MGVGCKGGGAALCCVVGGGRGGGGGGVTRYELFKIDPQPSLLPPLVPQRAPATPRTPVPLSYHHLHITYTHSLTYL